jgi:hypothetical protein
MESRHRSPDVMAPAWRLAPPLLGPGSRCRRPPVDLSPSLRLRDVPQRPNTHPRLARQQPLRCSPKCSPELRPILQSAGQLPPATCPLSPSRHPVALRTGRGARAARERYRDRPAAQIVVFPQRGDELQLRRCQRDGDITEISSPFSPCFNPRLAHRLDHEPGPTVTFPTSARSLSGQAPSSARPRHFRIPCRILSAPWSP